MSAQSARTQVYNRYLFPSSNTWGIPSLPVASIQYTPGWIIPYTIEVPAHQETQDGAVHFFLHDYRFETVWNDPVRSVSRVLRFPTVLTPDYSVYHYTPRIQQMWNVYRNRWCGALWIAQGLQVIPSLAWSNSESYDFAFLGVARHSLVAVSTLGVNLQDPLGRESFSAGFREMVRQLDPCRVLSYGNVPSELHGSVEIFSYPTRWQGIAAARRRGATIFKDERRFVNNVGGEVVLGGQG